MYTDLIDISIWRLTVALVATFFLGVCSLGLVLLIAERISARRVMAEDTQSFESGLNRLGK